MHYGSSSLYTSRRIVSQPIFPFPYHSHIHMPRYSGHTQMWDRFCSGRAKSRSDGLLEFGLQFRPPMLPHGPWSGLRWCITWVQVRSFLLWNPRGVPTLVFCDQSCTMHPNTQTHVKTTYDASYSRMFFVISSFLWLVEGTMKLSMCTIYLTDTNWCLRGS